MKYILKMPNGEEHPITFDGVIYKGDFLKFEGNDQQWEVIKRCLDIPFDLEEPISSVTLEVKPYP